MRIHKTHKRYISSVVAGLIVTAVTMTGFSYNDKTVTVMVDGAAPVSYTHLFTRLNMKVGIAHRTKHFGQSRS